MYLVFAGPLCKHGFMQRLLSFFACSGYSFFSFPPRFCFWKIWPSGNSLLS